jgi:hypothetical protein
MASPSDSNFRFSRNTPASVANNRQRWQVTVESAVKGHSSENAESKWRWDSREFIARRALLQNGPKSIHLGKGAFMA